MNLPLQKINKFNCLLMLLLLLLIPCCSDNKDKNNENISDEKNSDDTSENKDDTSEDKNNSNGQDDNNSTSTEGNDYDTDDADTSNPPQCTPLSRPDPNWYASPDGQDNAQGTKEDPLSLHILLSSQGPVQPGQRVELLEGTYHGQFISTVSGTPDEPIVFIAENDKDVVIDSYGGQVADDPQGALQINGAWTQFHNLIFTSSDPQRSMRLDGVTVYGENVKVVNCIIHNNIMGVGFWSSSIDSEFYGNIIYNNGYTGPTRGHGHAIYTQNRLGTKKLTQNIIFFGYGSGIHAYTEGGHIQGFDIQKNVWFRTGASVPGSSTEGNSDGCLTGGLQPLARTQIIENYSWGPETNSRSLRVGWGGDVVNETIVIKDNFLPGLFAVRGQWSGDHVINGNSFFGVDAFDPDEWPDNSYYSGLPTGTKIVTLPNEYDLSRIDIIAYNWDEENHVQVDATSILPEGVEYKIFSVFDLFGEPVLAGTYSGGIINIPMGTKLPPQPTNDSANILGADDPGKQFGVFILRFDCP